MDLIEWVLGTASPWPFVEPIARIPERRYWMGPRPQRRTPPLIARTQTLNRLGAFLFLIGFVAVFIQQAQIVLQIVLGAPIFEECLKLGLALLLTGWTERFHRGVGIPIRMLGAILVGLGFGVLEHYVTYSDEGTASRILRYGFHTLSSVVNMAVLETLLNFRDTRVRLASLVPAIFLHYVNNGLAITVGLLNAILPVGFAISAMVLTGLLVVLVATMVVPRRVGGALAGAIAPRLPFLPPYWAGAVRMDSIRAK